MSDRTRARQALAEFLDDVAPFIAAIEGVWAVLDAAHSEGRPFGLEVMRRIAEADPEAIYMSVQRDPASAAAVRDKALEGLEQARIHQGIMQRAMKTRKRISAEQADLYARLARALAAFQEIVAWLEGLHGNDEQIAAWLKRLQENDIDTHP